MTFLLLSIAAIGGAVASNAPPTLGNSVDSTTSSPVAVATTQPETTKSAQICRRFETLGSRLNVRRVCRTAAQWRVIDGHNKEQAKGLVNKSTFEAPTPKMGNEPRG